MDLDLIRNMLAVVSIVSGIIGFFILGIWLGPVALACGILALILTTEERRIESAFRICAIVGLVLGFYEVLFGILAITGVI